MMMLESFSKLRLCLTSTWHYCNAAIWVILMFHTSQTTMLQSLVLGIRIQQWSLLMLGFLSYGSSLLTPSKAKALYHRRGISISTTTPSQYNYNNARRSTSRRNLCLYASKSKSESESDHSFESPFLNQVEATIDRVLQKYDNNNNNNNNNIMRDILSVPKHDRESLGIARNLRGRLDALARNNGCRVCWLQRAHCVCQDCHDIVNNNNNNDHDPIASRINRIFLLMHHKEIGLVVDTAKLILAAYPQRCRLVVGGLAPQYQESVNQLRDAMAQPNCLVLFPSDEAVTFDTLQTSTHNNNTPWDLVVIDGTWDQAKRLYNRYIPPQHEGGPLRVQLSSQSVHTLAITDQGHQLRRHAEKWRQVSTVEATRLFISDMMATQTHDGTWNKLAQYQQLADAAAKRQLGPPRISPTY